MLAIMARVRRIRTALVHVQPNLGAKQLYDLSLPVQGDFPADARKLRAAC